MAEPRTQKNNKKYSRTAIKHLSKLEERMALKSNSMPQMNTSSKRSMKKILPWASALFAVISFTWAKDIWDILQTAKNMPNFLPVLNTNTPYLGNATFELWTVFIGYSIIVICIIAAFTGGILKSLKRGWNYLFYAYLTSVIVGILYLLLLSVNSSRAIFTFVAGLTGLYILFQLRDKHK